MQREHESLRQQVQQHLSEVQSLQAQLEAFHQAQAVRDSDRSSQLASELESLRLNHQEERQGWESRLRSAEDEMLAQRYQMEFLQHAIQNGDRQAQGHPIPQVQQEQEQLLQQQTAELEQLRQQITDIERQRTELSDRVQSLLQEIDSLQSRNAAERVAQQLAAIDDARELQQIRELLNQRIALDRFDIPIWRHFFSLQLKYLFSFVFHQFCYK
jgi:chromosome segregation ATPase